MSNKIFPNTASDLSGFAEPLPDDAEQTEFQRKLFEAIIRAGGVPIDLPVSDEVSRAELQRRGLDILSQRHERS